MLLARGSKVRILDIKAPAESRDGVEFLQGDLSNQASIGSIKRIVSAIDLD